MELGQRLEIHCATKGHELRVKWCWNGWCQAYRYLSPSYKTEICVEYSSIQNIKELVKLPFSVIRYKFKRLN